MSYLIQTASNITFHAIVDQMGFIPCIVAFHVADDVCEEGHEHELSSNNRLVTAG